MGYSTSYVPAAPIAPVTPVQSSQFHAQDEFGQYNYGYSNPTSAKQEYKTADGIVQGTYSYVDANGIVQTTNYVADGHGFRVAATNLPQAPVAAPIEPTVAAEVPAAVVPQVKTTDAIDLRGEDIAVVAPAVAPAYVANSWGNPSPYVYAAQAAPVYTTNYVPVAPVSTPVAAPVPVVAAASPIKASQFHAQ